MTGSRDTFLTICLVVITVLLFFPSIFLDHAQGLKYEDVFKAVPALVIGLITAYIGWQQHQTAAGQKRIAEDKHRLELFEKRFETYDLFLRMAVAAHKLTPASSFYINDEERDSDYKKNSDRIFLLKENENDLISHGEGSLFLFGPEVKSALDVARGQIFSKLISTEAVNKQVEQNGPSKTFISDFSRRDPTQRHHREMIANSDEFLRQFYQTGLPEVMKPYLQISPYLTEKQDS